MAISFNLIVKKRNPSIIMLVFGLSILLLACGSKAERERERGRSVQPKTVVAPDGSIRLTPEQAQATGIQTAAVTEQELASAITAIGRVQVRSGGESQLFSPFAGRIIADPTRLPRVGSLVKKGEVVAEVEQLVTASEKVQFGAADVQLQSSIEQAKQEIDLRQTELDRAKRLYDGGAVPLKQLQTAEFNLKQAEAKLEGAKSAKAKYDAILSQENTKPRRAPIRAPISGTVTAADLIAGQVIDPSKSLLTIDDLSNVWVEVAIHENDLPLVRNAQHVEFTTPANPERVYTGNLVTIGSVVDPANRTVKVIFAANNSDGGLKIGMTAETRIPKGSSRKVLLIPASAMLSEEGQSVVYVESRPGIYKRRAITTGERSGENIVVISGLNVGERVVTVGAQSLRSETFKGQIPTEEER